MVYIHNVLCYDMELKVFLYRLSMALVLGALIGVERQIKQRSAGLTTNALVALGACTFILISESVSRAGMTDNVRVLAQVVTGIGFLGAGVIMRDGFTIHGLNTAATLWCSAAIGSLCGFGLYFQAAIAGGAIIATHLLLKPLSDFFDSRPQRSVAIRNIGFSLTVITDLRYEMQVRNLLIETMSLYESFQMQKMKSTHNSPDGVVEIKLDIITYDNDTAAKNNFVKEISNIQCIREISTNTLTQKIEH